MKDSHNEDSTIPTKERTKAIHKERINTRMKLSNKIKARQRRIHNKERQKERNNDIQT